VRRQENAEQNHNLMIGNKAFENVAKFKYLEKTAINKICIKEETKSRLNLKNASHHSVQNFLSSCLLSKNIKTV